MLPDELFPLFSSSRGQRIYIDWNPEEEKEEPMSVHCLHTTLIDFKKLFKERTYETKVVSYSTPVYKGSLSEC